METQLDKIKDITKQYLHRPVEPVGLLMVDHPVFASAFVGPKLTLEQLQNRGSLGDLDFYTVLNPDGLKKATANYEEIIDKTDSASQLAILIQGRYRLQWLGDIRPYLSGCDFASILNVAWVSGVAKDIEEAFRWFESCKPDELMSESELAVFNNIPNEITLYRGVKKGLRDDGLSWTDDISIAEWFVTRHGDHGHVLKMIAKKEEILAYFDSRQEREYIVYPHNYEVLKEL